MTKVISPKKLIEVALPLDDINAAAAREKSIRYGHPSTLHLWWARRPLAAARAVIFAQMVNDPSETVQGDKRLRETQLKIQNEREKLFDIIRELVKWENTNNEKVLNRAREVIKESWRYTCELNKKHPQASELFNIDRLPALHDPFAGGGAIPLEAQRLGLESYASDLNPLPVMLNKAMIEIPPLFSGDAPIAPLDDEDSQQDLLGDWEGAKGLAEDVRRYGKWIEKEAKSRLKGLYPKVRITQDMAKDRPDLERYIGRDLEVISWLWARSVKSPNPVYKDCYTPLMTSFVLSTKKGKQVWLEPSVNNNILEFNLNVGSAPDVSKKGTKLARGANFECVYSGAPISSQYIKEQAQTSGLSSVMTALVLAGDRERVYISPRKEDLDIVANIQCEWKPNTPIAKHPQYIGVMNYGYDTYGDIFTNRQLFALKTVSDLIIEASANAKEASIAAGFSEDKAESYSNAVAVYLAFALDRMAMSGNTLVRWNNVGQKAQHCFGRQALPMLWDFAEVNFIGSATGSLGAAIKYSHEPLALLGRGKKGFSNQCDARSQKYSVNKVISTDPPYYDNVPYADLSDFFYSWLRPILKDRYPDLFSTLAVPKADELVADYKRHDGKDNAHLFFMNGMQETFTNIATQSNPAFPITIYYAFKQGETSEVGTSSSGWETFLEAVINSGFAVCGTWPMRTEMPTRQRAMGANALASSVVLVCQKRGSSAEVNSRRQFQRELRDKMPQALEAMIGGSNGASPIAPVDLAQAAIGPGMAIFSKYEAVLNQDGNKMSVHDALILINRAITDYLNPDSGNFDNDTLFCDSWFSQYGWGQGQFGEADTLARAKGTSVDGVRDAGVVESGGGKVRLLKWSEYPTDWDPKDDARIPVWEACHQMIRVLNQKGEAEAGALLARMPDLGEQVRQLAYHLYTLCERKKWAEEARAYNELIGSWHAIVTASNEVGHRGEQHGLDFDF
ncbi:TPA: DUF1156 domain-containing protein [Vibrio parahaemolyticus]|nr:DUF1156 domain-containing protein [Vibrio parahaemolyticus]